MTRKTKSTGAKMPSVETRDRDGNLWGGFINVDLEPDEKAHFKAWIVEVQDELLPALVELHVESKLKFSSAYDPENDCFIATLTGCGVSTQPKIACALSARGKDWSQALGLLIYKHNVMCEGDWKNYWTAKRSYGSEID